MSIYIQKARLKNTSAWNFEKLPLQIGLCASWVHIISSLKSISELLYEIYIGQLGHRFKFLRAIQLEILKFPWKM